MNPGAIRAAAGGLVRAARDRRAGSRGCAWTDRSSSERENRTSRTRTASARLVADDAWHGLARTPPSPSRTLLWHHVEPHSPRTRAYLGGVSAELRSQHPPFAHIRRVRSLAVSSLEESGSERPKCSPRPARTGSVVPSRDTHPHCAASQPRGRMADARRATPRLAIETGCQARRRRAYRGAAMARPRLCAASRA